MNSKFDIAVFILAAGFSSRMGEFKPLLPFPEEPLIDRQIRILRESGIKDIRVITGHKEEQIKPLLNKLGVIQISNQGYREGMYSSVKTAAADLMRKPASGFAILPVDYPLLYPKILAEIFSAFNPQSGRVLFPCHKGRRGHPPVIPAGLVAGIIDYAGPGGLGGFFDTQETPGTDFETESPGILIDIDTVNQYRKTLTLYGKHQRPDKNRCLIILQEQGAGPALKNHSIKVSESASAIARSLNKRGMFLDLELIRAAGLLHDLAKGKPNHAKAGADTARYYGLDLIARIIERHMDHDFSPEIRQGIISEGAIVFLADKYINGETVVPLGLRKKLSLLKYPGAEEHIARRFLTAEIIEEAIRDTAGIEPVLLADSYTIDKESNIGKEDYLPSSAC